MAMLARGFTGIFYTSSHQHFGTSEICFVLGWSVLFTFLRIQNTPQLLGTLITRLFT